MEYLCCCCNGSGEGMWDGAICRECRGWGGSKQPCDTCDGKGWVDEQKEDEEESQ
jgi:hypothetical protein